MSIQAYKYRLYPTKQQIERLQWILDRCRELYNAALQERKEAYKYARKSIGYYEQCRSLTEIKHEIRPEYKEISSNVLQNVLRRVDLAYKAFFRRVKAGEKPGFPRYQGKNRYDSFCFSTQWGWKLIGGRLSIIYLGSIKVKLHRPLQGLVKTCTVKREGEHWYVVVVCEIGAQDETRTSYTDEAVGIDLGLHHFAALSTGDTIDNPRYYRKAEKRLIKAQHILSRKKRGSNRRKKAVLRFAKCHRKVRNQRADFLHKQSRQLVNTYEILVFEELEPSKMSRRPKVRQDEATGQYLPNGASQKAGLNKSILDAGWSTFITMCEYKAACAGTVQVVKVDPYKTSQVCSGCHKEGPHKDLSERVHTCESCGLVLDRDVNAACNILAVSQGLTLRPVSKKLSKVARTEPSGSDRATT